MTWHPVVPPPPSGTPMLRYAQPQGGSSGGGGGGGSCTPSARLLDAYSGAVAAYSVGRQLKASAQAALRVRRSSDSKGAIIGFDHGTGALDTTTLLAFVGATNGQVDSLYDQVGDSGLQQTTAADRPLIVSAGSLVTSGTQPAMLFDSTDFLLTSVDRPNFGSDNVLSGNVAYTVFCVHKKTVNTAGSLYGWGLTGTSLAATGILDDGVLADSGLQFAGGNTFKTTLPAINTRYLTTVIKSAGAISTTTTVRRNGVSVAAGGSSTSTPNVNGAASLFLGRWANFASNGMQGNIQELIIFAGAKTLTDAAAIEADINAFYGIY